MSGLEEILMFLGSSVCHQLPERSYFFEGTQMPLCARCIGIHFGFILSVAFLYTGSRRYASGLPSLKQMVVMGAVMAFFLIDSALSYSGLSPSDNLRRTLSGLSLGIVVPFLLVPLVNYIVDPERNPRKLLDEPMNWLWMASLYVLALAAILASTSLGPLFLAVSVAGITGLFLFFTLGISIELLLVFEKRRIARPRVISLAFVVAVTLLMVLALVHEALFPAGQT